MINTITRNCHERYEHSSPCNCWSCSYHKHCPKDCSVCLHYIHSPTSAPSPRKYDCKKMSDYYVCKYSHKYMSELYYAFSSLRYLPEKRHLKILSIGCGPCTDLFALDFLKSKNVYNFDFLDYKGIEIDTKIWRDIHKDVMRYANSKYQINIINANACSYIDTLLSGDWYPDVIVFQYVFSDMYKHGTIEEINHLLEQISKFVDFCPNDVYLICNDINLSTRYSGGREFFDLLNQKINDPKKFAKKHFKNSNKNGHFEYGDEYRRNDLVVDIPEYLNKYNPFTSCSSAQLILKKVK